MVACLHGCGLLVAGLGTLATTFPPARAQPPVVASVESGNSHRSVRQDAVAAIPFHRLNPELSQRIDAIVRNPSFFRRMPSQRIECDPALFTLLVRRPEIMVNIWDVMGITNVSTRRLSPDTFLADDGMGTRCRCRLVYGTGETHIYYGAGVYDGTLSPREVRGDCVCVLHTQAEQDAEGRWFVAGTMDVFLKLDSFGADLIARTVGPFIGKTADYNFVETAKFISEIYELCRHNPQVAQLLAQRLDKVTPDVRREFEQTVVLVASHRSGDLPPTNSSPQRESWRSVSGTSPSPQSSTSVVGNPALADAEFTSSFSSAFPQAVPQGQWPRVAPRKVHLYLRR
ncbi:MAG: hypothetical protein KatS3mg111_3722 [Pirellulaceae bacterium]|nr:MAG: hypothetical protein KatS3mg111_3722 [Pirellulaceae bacterium]